MTALVSVSPARGRPSHNRPLGAGSTGFTLIEVMIAVVILAVGILGVTAMQSASLGGQAMARNLDAALNIASDALDRMQGNSEKITEYVGASYSGAFTVTTQGEAPLGGSYDTSGNAERPSGATAGADYDALFTGMMNMGLRYAQLSVALQNDVPITGLDTATATVTWTYKGEQKQCQIVQIISRD